jgi:hypothetical protein
MKQSILFQDVFPKLNEGPSCSQSLLKQSHFPNYLAVNGQVMHESAIQHTVEVHASPATSFIASDAASRIIELLQMQKDLPLARTSFIFFQPCVKLKNSS